MREDWKQVRWLRPRFHSRSIARAATQRAEQLLAVERVFMENASGTRRDRPELRAAFEYLRAGDTLVVWKLDRLARSVRQLVETAADLQQREIGLKVLTHQIDTTMAGGRLVSTFSLR